MYRGFPYFRPGLILGFDVNILGFGVLVVHLLYKSTASSQIRSIVYTATLCVLFAFIMMLLFIDIVRTPVDKHGFLTALAVHCRSTQRSNHYMRDRAVHLCRVGHFSSRCDD